MSAKQDRQGARTARDLEYRYNFGKSFAEAVGIATDAQRSAEQAQKAAESAKDTAESVDQKLTQEEIFNLLTNNGELQGLYRGDDGELYINADYIKAGTLRADEMKLVDGEESLYFMTWDEVNSFVEQIAEAMSLDTLKTYGCTVDSDPINGYGVIQIAVGKDADGFRSALVLLTADDAQMVRDGWAEGDDGVLYWSEWKTFGGADAVVEQGTSGIWTYRKWNSGKIELWTNSYQFTVTFTKSSIGIYYATQSGIAVPLVKTIEFASGDCTKWHYVNWSSVTCNGGTELGIRYYGLNANGGGNTIPFSFYVIGTWK